MSWSSKQIKLAQMACKGAGIEDEHRRLLLGQFDGRAMVNGRATSTSPHLRNADFEQFMASVEAVSKNQQLQVRDPRGRFVYGMCHWQQAAEDGAPKRLRYIINGLLSRIQDAELGLPIPSPSTVTNGRTQELKHLTTPELEKLRSALYAMAKRHGLLERTS
ncbi:MAG: hypothetical protein AAF797_06250 [Planctomycetota bacterium]